MKKISFIGSKGRGLNPDLQILKKYIEENSDIEMEMYFSNENSKNDMIGLGSKIGKENYSKKAVDLVCVDGSLPAKKKLVNPEGTKVLVATPYDFLLKALNRGDSNKKTFQNFTHIMVNSPIEKKIIDKVYKTKGIEVIEDYTSPMAYDIYKQTNIEEKREKLESYYPAAKGKKILAILLSGKFDDDEENPYKDLDWKVLADNVPDDWFIVTNSEELMENAVHLGPEYQKKVGFMKQMLDFRKVLYLADALVTNTFMFATCFAAVRKPVFAIFNKNNGFEQYMHDNYPNLWISDLTKIGDKVASPKTEDFEKFWEEFSYKPDKNPCAKVLEILSK